MTLIVSPVMGLIPARSGSKGVLEKKMRRIAGKPLIDFSIRAAQQSNLIENVYVSSDDPAILQHAQTLGATGIVNRLNLPRIRPLPLRLWSIYWHSPEHIASS